METFKTVVRMVVALFVAFFGTVQPSMTVFAPPASAAWVQWPCHAHPLVSSALSFITLLVLTLLVLSRRCAQWRVPLAVVLLLTYGIYGVADAIGYRTWWLALAPVVAAAAAVGVGLRARWGTLMTYAVSTLFALYWIWSVAAAVLNGTFSSRPPLFGALMLVPGIAFGLLAGFCCYASSGMKKGTGSGSGRYQRRA